jgi:thymidylate synthase (FAD)
MSKNKVELLDYFGGDLNHANVARVSFSKEAENYTDEQNTKLIKYLVNHGHTSPFRHSTLQFRIKCPIYVERQLHKHQVGVSVNSVSGRYVDFSDSYYQIPFGEWRKQSKSSKQGSEGFLNEEDQLKAFHIQEEIIVRCKGAYEDLLNLGVSKEQARSVLPLSLETEFIWTGSFLAFTHMCDLRLKEDTQKETRDVVRSMLYLVKNIEGNPFKYSLKAFGYE